METETKPLWTTTREAMGKTWRVELWPDDVGIGSGAGSRTKSCHLGRAWFTDQWLRIAASRPLDGRDSTLLHELIHLVELSCGLDFKESEVVALAENLYAFLRGFGIWQPFPWPDQEKEEA